MTHSEPQSPKMAKRQLLASIFSGRFAQGLYYAVPYTTLLDMAQKYQVPTDNISEIYSYRGSGIIVGAVMFSIYMEFLPYAKRVDPMTWVGIFTFASSVMLCIVPLVTAIEWLKIGVLVSGIGYGVQELGFKSVILDTFGPVKSKGPLQANALMYSIGNVVSILLAIPFLNDDARSTSCQGIMSTNSTHIRHETGTKDSFHRISLVDWPWIISGLFTFLASVLIMFAGLKFVRIPLKKYYQPPTDTVEELELTISTPKQSKSTFFQYDLWIVLCIFLLSLCSGGSQHWYQDYIYNFGTCVMKMEPKTASGLATAIVVSMSVGRAIGVFTVRWFKPATLLVVDLVLFTGSFAILYFYEIGSVVVWMSVILFGLAFATLQPLTISVGAEYIEMSKIYSMSFVVGSFIGHSLSPLGSKSAIDSPKEWILYGGIFSAFGFLPLCLLLVFGPRLRSRYRHDLDVLVMGAR